MSPMVCRLLRAAAAGVVAVTVACGSDPAGPRADATIPAGRYLLERVDGQTMPTRLDLFLQEDVSVYADTLVVATDGTFTWNFRVRGTEPTPRRFAETGRFDYATDGVVYVYLDDVTIGYLPNGSIGTAHLDGTALRISGRPPWPNEGGSDIDFSRLR